MHPTLTSHDDIINLNRCRWEKLLRTCQKLLFLLGRWPSETALALVRKIIPIKCNLEDQLIFKAGLTCPERESFPGKDTMYRFLNQGGYAWRRFLL